jgi:hypothetical protein
MRFRRRRRFDTWSQIEDLVAEALDRLLEWTGSEEDAQGEITLLIRETLDATAEPLADAVERLGRKEIRRRSRYQRGFERRLWRVWGPGLDLCAIVTGAVHEAGEEFAREHGDALRDDPVFQAMALLHARSTMVAAEGYTLLRAGFPEGARTRWRTLHEIAVTAHVITDMPELAQRLLDHMFVDTYSDALVYQQRSEHLGPEPFSEEELADMKQTRDRIAAKYEPDFAARPYGWVGSALGKARPTFDDLERQAGLSHLRPYYRHASHGIHGGLTGAYRTVVQGGAEARAWLVGATNAGLAEPASGILVSLIQIVTPFLVKVGPAPRFREPMRLPALQVLMVLQKRANDALLAADHFVREETARREGLRR